MFDNEPDAVLIPAMPFRPLVFGEYLDRGTEHRLFEGECVDTVCRTGGDPYLYYVVSGCLTALYLHEDGTTLPFYKRSAGNAFQTEFAGIASVGKSDLQFRADVNSVVVSFTFDQTYELVKKDPRAFRDLIYTAHMCFGQFAHRLDSAGMPSSSLRVLSWLVKLADVNRPGPDGRYRIRCNMTMQDLSDLFLIHVTTCSRIFGALKAKGVADRTRQYVLINDAAELRRLAAQENPVLY